MKVTELIDLLKREIEKSPAFGMIELRSEGCDCWGTVEGFVQTLDGNEVVVLLTRQTAMSEEWWR